jgi:hypothetical protein
VYEGDKERMCMRETREDVYEGDKERMCMRETKRGCV